MTDADVTCKNSDDSATEADECTLGVPVGFANPFVISITNMIPGKKYKLVFIDMFWTSGDLTGPWDKIACSGESLF